MVIYTYRYIILNRGCGASPLHSHGVALVCIVWIAEVGQLYRLASGPTSKGRSPFVSAVFTTSGADFKELVNMSDPCRASALHIIFRINYPLLPVYVCASN